MNNIEKKIKKPLALEGCRKYSLLKNIRII